MKKYLLLAVSTILIVQPILADDLIRSSADGRDWYFSMGGGDPYVNYRQNQSHDVRF